MTTPHPTKSAPAPAAVAYRVLRKRHDGEWVTDGRAWCDGVPTQDLVDDIALRSDGWRIEYAFAAPTTQAAPTPAVQQGDASPTMPRDIEMMATNRYRPVPSGVLAYKVVGGDGNRSLFSGTKDECQIVARKLTEAFLDGAYVALSTHPAAPAAQGDALDAARWRMLPAFFHEYQIDALKLFHDIDAAIDAARAAKEGDQHG